jgi:hypothetical protein
MSAWAKDRQLPWMYSYSQEAQATRLGEPVYRPFVPVSLAYGQESTTLLDGLVDTGADAILASDLLCVELGLDLAENEGESTHAVGGKIVLARYKTIGLRLHPSPHDDDVYREWQAQVGFVEGWHSDGFVLLGSVGFLDEFTVTANRFAQGVAVEERDAFDERFGMIPSI